MYALALFFAAPQGWGTFEGRYLFPLKELTRLLRHSYTRRAPRAFAARSQRAVWSFGGGDVENPVWALTPVAASLYTSRESLLGPLRFSSNDPL